MGSRKRGRDEMESSEPAPEPSMLSKIRNMWEFANLMQYIFIFGKAVKIDENLDIEDLERECLLPESSKVLSDIGLALLKCVSSHRGLTPDIFDEYTRRQYLAKAPARNPFGEDDEPRRFTAFDVFTKIRVLVQLSQWTLINAERMREKMSDTSDNEQIQWRIEEVGYDKQERYYFVLDDNRLYRRTDPKAPAAAPTKPKAKSKKVKAALRASKRRKSKEVERSDDEADAEGIPTSVEQEQPNGDEYGGRKWECIAVTLGEYQDFLRTIEKSKDLDEKMLHERLVDDVLPIIEKQEESQLRKKQRQERESFNIQKLATAKRSSRLEAKQEKERQEQEVLEAERKRKAELAAAKADQEKQKNVEVARENRIMTREQRIKDREHKRILHEEELANLSEENKKLDAGEGRLSERHLKAEVEKKKRELAALAEDDEWFFDCSVCGAHGTNFDDGSHSVSCEKCDVWQHSHCHGISQEAAEKEDFHFVCLTCRRREEDAKKPKIPSLKFRIGVSSSPPSQPTANQAKKRKSGDDTASLPPMKRFKQPDSHRHLNGDTSQSHHRTQNGMHATVMNGPTLSPQGQSPPKLPPSLFAGNNPYNASQGPKSSPSAPAYTKSYNKAPGQQNGYSQQPPQVYHTYVANGSAQAGAYPSQGGYQFYQGSHPAPQRNDYSVQNIYPNHQAGWSARYMSPQNPQNQGHFTASSHTSNSQGPTSSHSVSNAQSTSKQGHSHASPQNNVPGPQQIDTPQHSGRQNQTSLPITGSSAISPTKHVSPQSTSPKNLPSSSPATHQPPLQPTGPPSPGFSPVKHSPPHPTAPSSGLGINSNPAVLPPVAQLSPNPTQQDFLAPANVMIPEQAKSPMHQ